MVCRLSTDLTIAPTRSEGRGLCRAEISLVVPALLDLGGAEVGKKKETRREHNTAICYRKAGEGKRAWTKEERPTKREVLLLPSDSG